MTVFPRSASLIVFACLCVLAPLTRTASGQEVVRVSEFVRAGGDSPDWADPINRALRSADPGDTVVLDWRDTPYVIRSAVRIGRDGVTLDGRGATIRFADNAMGGEIVDCVEVLGSLGDPVEGVTVKNLTIDANYWNQPGSHNPRGFDSDHARDLLVESVTIVNAFVGLTFGLGVEGAEARGCTVRRYFDDAFNASGDGVSGGASDVLFEGCLAEDARNEANGGPPGVRNNAWEIEDGAQDITVRGCAVRNVDGNGFAVRNHDGDVSTARIAFLSCSAENVSGLGWHAFSGGFPNRVESIRLVGCSSDSVVRLHKDIRGLRIERCVFDAAVTLGPARDAEITASTFGWLRIWTEPPPGDSLGGSSYQPAYRFENCVLRREPWILGDPRHVTFDGGSLVGD